MTGDLATLQAEVERLRTENEELRQRLLQYEGAVPDDASVAAAVEQAFADYGTVTSSDWIATYYVLTTRAQAPLSYAAFADWANSLRVPHMPPCKADLLRKADPLYLRPLYRWDDSAAVCSSKLRRRLAVARCLRSLLS